MAFSAQFIIRCDPYGGGPSFFLANGDTSTTPGVYHFIIQADGQECVSAGFYNSAVYTVNFSPAGNWPGGWGLNTHLNGPPCPGGTGHPTFTDLTDFGVPLSSQDFTLTGTITIFNSFGGQIWAQFAVNFTYVNTTPTPPTPSVPTVPHDLNVPVGTATYDTAQVLNVPANQFPAVLVFYIKPPSASVFTQVGSNIPVDANGGTYQSVPYTPMSAGVYQWSAVLAGQHSNIGLNSNDPSERFTAYTPIATAHVTSEVAEEEVDFGLVISDEATLLGGTTSPAVSGTLTFDCYGPDDDSCDPGNMVFTDSVVVSGNGVYASGSFTPSLPGVYRWVVAYSGDAHNSAYTSPCGDSGEQASVKVTLSNVLCGDLFAITQGSSVEIRVEQFRSGGAVQRRLQDLGVADDRSMSCDFDGDGALYFIQKNGPSWRVKTDTSPFAVESFLTPDAPGITAYNAHVDNKNRIYFCFASVADLFLDMYNRTGQLLERFSLPFPTTGAAGNQNDYTGGAISADGSIYYSSWGSLNLVKRYDLVNRAPLSDISVALGGGGENPYPTGIRCLADGRILVRSVGAINAPGPVGPGLVRVYADNTFASFLDRGDPNFNDLSGVSDVQGSLSDANIAYASRVPGTSIYTVDLTSGVTALIASTISDTPNTFPIAVKCVSGGRSDDLEEYPDSVRWATEVGEAPEDLRRRGGNVSAAMI